MTVLHCGKSLAFPGEGAEYDPVATQLAGPPVALPLADHVAFIIGTLTELALVG